MCPTQHLACGLRNGASAMALALSVCALLFLLLFVAAQVLDCRVAPSSSAVTHGVLRLPFKGLSTAAACGNIVAAGGREGVRAWDVRMCSSSHSSSGGSSSSLLLSGTLPSKAPVTLLHLDSLKLVAASHQTQLHSAAGVAVWSLPECHRVDVPSSW